VVRTHSMGWCATVLAGVFSGCLRRCAAGAGRVTFGRKTQVPMWQKFAALLQTGAPGGGRGGACASAGRAGAGRNILGGTGCPPIGGRVKSEPAGHRVTMEPLAPAGHKEQSLLNLHGACTPRASGQTDFGHGRLLSKKLPVDVACSIAKGRRGSQHPLGVWGLAVLPVSGRDRGTGCTSARMLTASSAGTRPKARWCCHHVRRQDACHRGRRPGIVSRRRVRATASRPCRW
jgi:hypothetical protein